MANEQQQQAKIYDQAQAPQEPKHPSIRERIAGDLHSARRQSYRASRLEELGKLLDEHPDVARILDLIQEVERY